mmetsp:Transcript_19594/g.14048  ORF Transcript_19594/g.14048 Transcript_19594/m.14048 type:complete len:100 (+) Transcript_19594:226-525(+)
MEYQPDFVERERARKNTLEMQYEHYEQEKAPPFRANLQGISVPVSTTCYTCRKVTRTIVIYETTPMQWYICMMLFLCGIFFLAPIPFYPKSFYNAKHFC